MSDRDAGQAITSWLIHRSQWIYAGVLLFMGVFMLVPRELRAPFAWPAVVVLVASLAGWTWHNRNLCVRCAVEFPDNGPDLAEQRAWWLYLHHLNGSWVSLIKFAALTLGLIFLPDTGKALMFALLFIDSALYHVSAIRHRQLLPWCPHCRNDGWDDEESEDPVPAGDGSRSA